MQRYSTITKKNPREIVLLRGRGCRYRRCAFCDYHEDASCDEAANLAINTEALKSVTGQYGTLEIVNSGSFCELEESTMKAIIGVCVAKGINETDPAKIADAGFNECCLLFGLPGQTAESMRTDIETGLRHFERVCVNIMIENSAPLQPCDEVRQTFVRDIYPEYKENQRVDILLHNTDFGVGK